LGRGLNLNPFQLDLPGTFLHKKENLSKVCVPAIPGFGARVKKLAFFSQGAPLKRLGKGGAIGRFGKIWGVTPLWGKPPRGVHHTSEYFFLFSKFFSTAEGVKNSRRGKFSERLFQEGGNFPPGGVRGVKALKRGAERGFLPVCNKGGGATNPRGFSPARSWCPAEGVAPLSRKTRP